MKQTLWNVRSILSIFVPALLLVSASAYAQATSAPSLKDKCLGGNAEVRAQLSAAPGMNALSTGFARLLTDDAICDCVGSHETQADRRTATDPEKRFIKANAACLPAHVSQAFPAMCPAAFGSLIPDEAARKASEGKIAEACNCASAALTRELTPETFERSELAQYAYFQALAKDRQNHTDNAKTLRPGADAVDAVFGAMESCFARSFPKAASAH